MEHFSNHGTPIPFEDPRRKAAVFRMSLCRGTWQSDAAATATAMSAMSFTITITSSITSTPTSTSTRTRICAATTAAGTGTTAAAPVFLVEPRSNRAVDIASWPITDCHWAALNLLVLTGHIGDIRGVDGLSGGEIDEK